MGPRGVRGFLQFFCVFVCVISLYAPGFYWGSTGCLLVEQLLPEAYVTGPSSCREF